MKTRISLSIAILLFSASVYASQFCAGFEAGYITGYKQASGSGLAPLTPICPLQPLKGFGDPESDYEHGYTIGYRKGVAAGSQ